MIKVSNQDLGGKVALPETFLNDYKVLLEAASPKAIFGLQYVESPEAVKEGFLTHHYMIEKSGDKLLYHFDLIGTDGERTIRSKELTDQVLMDNPGLLKSKLDEFISKLDKNRLPSK